MAPERSMLVALSALGFLVASARSVQAAPASSAPQGAPSRPLRASVSVASHGQPNSSVSASVAQPEPSAADGGLKPEGVEGDSAASAGSEPAGGAARDVSPTERSAASSSPAAPAAEGYGPPQPTGKVVADRGFSGAGRFVLSAEHLFGFASTSTTIKLKNGSGDQSDIDSDSSGFTFLGGGAQAGLQAPQLAVDYFFGKVFSLGAAAYLSSDSFKGGSSSGSSFQPRVGFFFGGNGGFWLRTGLEFWSQSLKADEFNSELSGTAWVIEALGVAGNAQGFAMSAGPAVYIPLGGSATGADSASTSAFGISVSIHNSF